MATKDQISSLVNLTKSAFPLWRVNDQTFETWFKMLSDLPAENLQAAVLACNTEPGRAFAPTIGEIRGKNVELEARSNGVPTVYEAWEELLNAPRDAMLRLPPEWCEEQQLWILYQAPYQWRHPLVEKVARQLGWPDSFPGELLSVSLAQFRDAYQAAYTREIREAAEIPEIRVFIDRRKQEIAALEVQKLVHKMAVDGFAGAMAQQPGSPEDCLEAEAQTCDQAAQLAQDQEGPWPQPVAPVFSLAWRQGLILE